MNAKTEYRKQEENRFLANINTKGPFIIGTEDHGDDDRRIVEHMLYQGDHEIAFSTSAALHDFAIANNLQLYSC